MVAQQVLVLFVVVRIRVRQQQGRVLKDPPLLLSYIDMNLRNINHTNLNIVTPLCGYLNINCH